MTKFHVTMHQINVTVVEVDATSKIEAKSLVQSGQGVVVEDYINEDLERCHKVEPVTETDDDSGNPKE